MMHSKTQIDKLGDTLRVGPLTEKILRDLDEYGRSFGGVYSFVTQKISEQSYISFTGRPVKSTRSLIDKLIRESCRLSQVQDVSGCRIVVDSVLNQNKVVYDLKNVFSGLKFSIVDRRKIPNHGYRAVHFIVSMDGKPFEIQIRTRLQHQWAEYSEKISDAKGAEIKYGGGPKEIKDVLMDLSELVGLCEENEVAAFAYEKLLPSDESKKFSLHVEEQRNRIHALIERMERALVKQ